MSMTDAEAFLERAETDAEWGAELDAIRDDSEAVLAKVREAGYDVTRQEVLDAIMERYGAELTLEQLGQFAAGSDAEVIAGAVAAVCAAFAA